MKKEYKIDLLKGPGNPAAHKGVWWGMFFSNIFAFIIILVWYLAGKWKKVRINDKKEIIGVNDE